MRYYSVRLLLVAMFATQHTDFESFANALGALPNQPPVPMACEPSPSPIDVDTKAIVQQVVDVLLKHSPSPAVHLEVLGRRWLALARNESVTNLTSTLLPAKVPAMNMRDKRARDVLELMPVTRSANPNPAPLATPTTCHGPRHKYGFVQFIPKVT